MSDFKTSLVPVGRIKLDDTNPNAMDAEQFAALKRSIGKYGFLVPVITNKDLIVADGEHRLRAAKELGFKEVPVVRLDLKEIDRRILRQVMNKLKGRHDIMKDISEFKVFADEGRLAEFSKLIGREESEFQGLIKGFITADKIMEKEFDESLSTKLKCPKCGYEW